MSTTAPAAVGRRWWLAVFAACGVAAITLAWLDMRDAWFAPKDEFKVGVQLLIYWGCWSVWPASVMLAWCALARWRQGLRRRALWPVVGFIGCALLVWMRFIEPSLLVVRATSVSSTCGVRVALISDLHLGIYGRTHDLDRLVDRLNTLEVDAVLIAGDITVEPPRDLVHMLAPLKRLRHRTLSVTGNHDEQHPGAPLTQALRDALTTVNVRSIEGQRVPLGTCELLGMGDLRSGSAQGDLYRLRTNAAMMGATDAAHRLVLVHDPRHRHLLPEQLRRHSPRRPHPRGPDRPAVAH